MEKLTTAKALVFLWNRHVSDEEEQCLLNLADLFCCGKEEETEFAKTLYVFSDGSAIETERREGTYFLHTVREIKKGDL